MENNPKPLVSIAMPFHNCERTIGLAVRSILLQTYENFELLACNDGSVDRSEEIVRSFTDPRVKLLGDRRRMRLAVRLNECIDHAQGTYFARMDADDISVPTRLAEQVNFLCKNREADVASTFLVVFKGDLHAVGKMTAPCRHEELIARPYRCIKVFHGAWMGKMDWFRTFRYDESCELAQDQELLFRARGSSTYAVIPKLLYGYRQENLPLKRMLRSRYLRTRHRMKTLGGPAGFVRGAALGFTESAKACVDCFAVGSGLGYRILRHRGMPLSQDETREWNRICEILNSELQTVALHAGPWNELNSAKRANV